MAAPGSAVISRRATPRTWRCSVCHERLAGTVKTCTGCRTRRGTKRTSLSARCDKLWADYIKRPGKCFRCGKTEGLQAAHIIPRAHRSTRWSLSPQNGICLCHSCHRMFDGYKIDRYELILSAIGLPAHVALVNLGMLSWDRDYDRVLRELKDAK